MRGLRERETERGPGKGEPRRSSEVGGSDRAVTQALSFFNPAHPSSPVQPRPGAQAFSELPPQIKQHLTLPGPHS